MNITTILGPMDERDLDRTVTFTEAPEEFNLVIVYRLKRPVILNGTFRTPVRLFPDEYRRTQMCSWTSDGDVTVEVTELPAQTEVRKDAHVIKKEVGVEAAAIFGAVAR